MNNLWRQVGPLVLRPPSSGGGISLLEAVTFTPTGGSRNDNQTGVGYQFRVSTTLVVAALGRWKSAGNSGTHAVSIYKFTTGTTPQASCVVDLSTGTSGSFVYANLGTPYTLFAATDYSIESAETNGDAWEPGGAFSVAPQNGDLLLVAETYGGGSFANGPGAGINNPASCYCATNFKYHY